MGEEQQKSEPIFLPKLSRLCWDSAIGTLRSPALLRGCWGELGRTDEWAPEKLPGAPERGWGGSWTEAPGSAGREGSARPGAARMGALSQRRRPETGPHILGTLCPLRHAHSGRGSRDGRRCWPHLAGWALPTFGSSEEQLVRGVQAEDRLGVALGHGDALQRGRPPPLGSSNWRDDPPSRTEAERAPISWGHHARLRGAQGRVGTRA